MIITFVLIPLMTRLLRQIIFIFLIFPLVGMSQFADDFSDGNFTANPTWSGDDSNFEINSGGRLHLNAPASTDESYLSTPSVAIDTASWEFFIRLEFNPSSSNRARVYLISDQANLEGALNGYFVQIGNTEDEISLYRQSGTTTTKIIDGVDDLVDLDPVEAMVRVTRSTNGLWELYADTSTSSNYQLMGQSTDTSFLSSSYFGVWCDYTATRSDKFFFDDFLVTGNAYLDLDPPFISSVQAQTSNQVLVTYSEAIDTTTAQTLTNYDVNNSIGAPTSASVNAVNAVLLTFSNAFTLGATYTLTVSDVEDLAGNALLSASENFQYVEFSAAEYRDVVINEIMADPSPIVGLPELEFIEIYNASSKFIQLDSAQISDPSTVSMILGSELLAPQEYVILCHQNNVGAFSGFGRVIGLSTFPGINNAADELKLFVAGELVDEVNFTDAWYLDATKKLGGYSLEQINPEHPCTGMLNWRASDSPSGGTPGTQNSVFDNSPDVTAPEVSKLEVVGVTELMLTFSKLMDSLSIANAVFSIDNGLSISGVSIADALVSTVSIQLSAAIDSSLLYTLSISGNISDCLGNLLSTESVAFGLGVTPRPFDIVINELYPDPDELSAIPTVEFVELYNRSDKLLRLEGLSLSDRSTSSAIFPSTLGSGAYIIVCDDDNAALFEAYGKTAPVSTMPSLNNAEDFISLKKGELIIDQVSYDDSWYGSTTYASGGYTLERINPEHLCGLASNWQASLSEEGGTPGQVNTVYSSADFPPLSLLGGQFTSLQSVELTFDRRMDTTSIATSRVYLAGETFVPDQPTVDLTRLSFTRTQEFTRGTLYSFLVDSISDCAGMKLKNTSIELYLHDSGDVVINEVLTNPRGSGTDFIELYSNSEHPLSLMGWSLAYFDSKDSLRFNSISTSPLRLNPNEYIALNEDNADLVFNYAGALNQHLIEMNLPSYANDAASVLLYDNLGSLMESFEYSAELHFDLIDNLDGVSLERLDPKRVASDVGNWHSASSTENYGTPGYQNSQSLSSAGTSGFTLSSDYVSPDNDGYQDNVNIDFVLSTPETVLTINIYNDKGMLIRALSSNLVVGTSGSITWDGTNDGGEKARTGIHVIVVETFDLKGNRSVNRLPIVVASRL